MLVRTVDALSIGRCGAGRGRLGAALGRNDDADDGALSHRGDLVVVQAAVRGHLADAVLVRCEHRHEHAVAIVGPPFDFEEGC